MAHKVRWLLAAIALILCALYLTRTAWLEQMGQYLVNTQDPQKAGMIVVIGGDWFGNRILKGAELAKAGYAPKVLVSGNGYLYGSYESDVAVQFAVNHGYDAQFFVPFHHPVNSTREEAEAVIPELRRRGVKKYILVTSEFHTRRAGNIFRKAGPDLQMVVVACPDTLHWNNWWQDREGRKSFFFEWLKTVTGAFGA